MGRGDVIQRATPVGRVPGGCALQAAEQRGEFIPGKSLLPGGARVGVHDRGLPVLERSSESADRQSSSLKAAAPACVSRLSAATWRMGLPKVNGIGHIDLTVTDADR